MDLMSFVRRTMFDSVVRQLFGADNVPETETGMRELERKFVKFDEDFEYGTQLPEFLIRSEKYSRADHLKLNHPPKIFSPRDWSECKYWLLSFFKKMVEKLRGSTIRGGNDQVRFLFPHYTNVPLISRVILKRTRTSIFYSILAPRNWHVASFHSSLTFSIVVFLSIFPSWFFCLSSLLLELYMWTHHVKIGCSPHYNVSPSIARAIHGRRGNPLRREQCALRVMLSRGSGVANCRHIARANSLLWIHLYYVIHSQTQTCPCVS